MSLLSLAIESIFINNVLLALFLGLCTFLGCSKEVKKMLNLADGGRIPFGIGGLTTEERKTLKKALKDGELTQAEYNKHLKLLNKLELL